MDNYAYTRFMSRKGVINCLIIYYYIVYLVVFKEIGHVYLEFRLASTKLWYGCMQYITKLLTDMHP